MTYSASASHLGPEFDDFLFAPIGAEKNGMLLSVLSALARLDIDPWQEAAKLAGLPGETATHRLASLIAELPDEPSPHPDPVTIAARLIALLPRPTNPNIASRKALFGANVATHPRAAIYLYVITTVFRAGCPMDCSKPSTVGARRQRSGAGLRHRSPTDAPAKRWPVTGRTMTDDQMERDTRHISAHPPICRTGLDLVSIIFTSGSQYDRH